MTERRWKRCEREIADILGGQRVPINGRRGADVSHPFFAIEVKSRETIPQWLRGAVGQAVAVATEGQLPVAVLHEVGARHGDDLVVMRLSDFKDWVGEVSRSTLNARLSHAIVVCDRVERKIGTIKMWDELGHRAVHVRMKRFLNAYVASGGRCNKAEELAGVDTHSHYRWRKEDPTYAACFERAQELAGDVLEAEAVRRAVEGYEEPVYYQGQQCGEVTKYSDGLLRMLVKGAKPLKYQDRHDITSGGQSLRIVIDAAEDEPDVP